MTSVRGIRRSVTSVACRCHELKVDRSFVKNLTSEKQDAIIVRSTIEPSHDRGSHVVGDGIQNGPTIERLRELGTDIGQGYGISRPLPQPMYRTRLAQPDITSPTPDCPVLAERSSE